jgi:hypothetical protein
MESLEAWEGMGILRRDFGEVRSVEPSGSRPRRDSAFLAHGTLFARRA